MSHRSEIQHRGRQEFSYNIDDMARYYRTYLELMRHWLGDALSTYRD